MSDNQLKFVDDFPTPTYDEWVAEVDKALKGAPFDKKMFTKTYEGITVRPIYTHQDWPSTGDPSGFPGAMPFTRGSTAVSNRVDDWDVRQIHSYPDPAKCNELILKELERGVTSLILRFDGAAKSGLDADGSGAEALAGDDGIMVYSVDDLDLLLTGVHLDLAPISLDAGAQFLPAAGLLAGLWQRRGVSPDKADGAFNADPVGALAKTGSLPVSVDAALAQMADLAGHTAATYAKVTAVGVDTSPYHNAGASESQDLAASMATAVAYLRAMTDAGMDIDAACRQILFTYSVDCDQFLTICKLRAARKIWARIAEACGGGVPARAMRLHARTADRMMSQRDAWVNMLRTTVACFAAAVGGAESVTVLPFTAALGLPDDLGRRVARNTHVVLAEESNIVKVIDPAAGSWYVETRTDELARAAWAEFQEIEKAGGIVRVLNDGSFAKKIAASYAEREKNLARRKDPLTGISEFPNIAEKRPPCEQPDLAAAGKAAKERLAATRSGTGSEAASLVGAINKTSASQLTSAVFAAAGGGATIGLMANALKGDATSLTALPRHRLAEKFEALRDASDAYLEKTGKRPSIFLANLGPIARHTARASFAKNFFEVGGIEGLTNTGFKDAESCAQAFKKSGAAIAILCSADPVYEEMVPTVAPALKAAGCKRLYLAGHPGDKKDAYMQAGLDDFIFMGADVLVTARSALALLGAIDQ
jgi:methylmalonyl-CoA mutase